MAPQSHEEQHFPSTFLHAKVPLEELQGIPGLLGYQSCLEGSRLERFYLGKAPQQWLSALLLQELEHRR